MPTYRRYTDQQRASAVDVLQQLQGNVAAAANLTGIPRTTLKHWLDAQSDQISSQKIKWCDQIDEIGDAPAGAMTPNQDSDDFRGSLPVHIATRYERAALNLDPTSLTRLIALLDVRIQNALTGLDIGDSTLLWERLRAAADTLVAIEHEPADSETREARRRTAIHNLVTLIDHGLDERVAWDEVVTLIDRRRRLCSTEMRRRQLNRALLATAEYERWQHHIGEVLVKHIPDADTLAAISDDLDQIVSASV